jgi:hypothetical protein
MEVKEAPARGLRAVFAGFGRALGGLRKSGVAPTTQAETTSDNGHVKVTASEAAAQETAVPETVVAETPAPKAKPQAAAAETATPETVVAETPAPKAKAPTPKAKTPAPKAEPQAAAAKTATPETAASDADLPLANYDTLTVASLRARLRTLTIPQLQLLIDYEKAHLGREEVTGMFERRIAKIVAGETTGFPAVS